MSTADLANLGDLLSEGGRTAFIIDGDEAGTEYEENLVSRGVNEEQIFRYSDWVDEPLVLEDLVDPEIYVESVNEELAYWQPEEWSDVDEELSSDELPRCSRDTMVQEWCEAHGLDPVQKTTLSQRLADKAGDGDSIVAPEYDEILVGIDRQAREYFNID